MGGDFSVELRLRLPDFVVGVKGSTFDGGGDFTDCVSGSILGKVADFSATTGGGDFADCAGTSCS